MSADDINYEYLKERYGELVAQQLMKEIEKAARAAPPRAVTQWDVKAFPALEDLAAGENSPKEDGKKDVA